VHDPSHINRNNLSNIRREVSRHFRNKKKKYLKDELNELARNSMHKNIRDLYRDVGATRIQSSAIIKIV
jgi:hypothetical protein